MNHQTNFIAVQHRIHDRVERIMRRLNRVPPVVPVTQLEYHMLESFMKFPCYCVDYEERKKHPLVYEVDGQNVIAIIDNQLAMLCRSWDYAG